uniref:Nuclear-export cofactor Arc1-like N-terminal domain-containing protein n=1 Tax=Catagonus wagneri TaxID=51154 RepID=A0A8C3W2M8_9CETA
MCEARKEKESQANNDCWREREPVGGKEKVGGGRHGKTSRSFFLVGLASPTCTPLFLHCCTVPQLAVAVGPGDLKSLSSLQVLNDCLGDKSYMTGYVPTQADVVVFEAVSHPPAAHLCHAPRWNNHIRSYEKEKTSEGSFGQVWPCQCGRHHRKWSCRQ